MEINITILDIIINQQIFLYLDVHIFIIIKSEFFIIGFQERVHIFQCKIINLSIINS